MSTTKGVKVEEYFSDPQVQSLVKAACRGNTKKVKELVASGVDVNTPGKDEVSPLFWVVGWCEERNRIKGVKALLELGADPNQPDENGYTPLYVVSTYMDSRYLRAMLDHGGNPDITVSRETSLSRAFSLGAHRDLWENYYMLLDAGADININYNLPSNPGTIADMAAGTYGRFDKAMELIERGLDRKYYAYLLRSVAIRDINSASSLRKDAAYVKSRKDLMAYLEARLTEEEKREYEKWRTEYIEALRRQFETDTTE